MEETRITRNVLKYILRNLDDGKVSKYYLGLYLKQLKFFPKQFVKALVVSQ